MEAISFMLLIKPFRKNGGGRVAESRMRAWPIVKYFDVLGNLSDQLLPGFVTSLVEKFILECSQNLVGLTIYAPLHFVDSLPAQV